jgi:hypothetical protein
LTPGFPSGLPFHGVLHLSWEARQAQNGLWPVLLHDVLPARHRLCLRKRHLRNRGRSAQRNNPEDSKQG